MPRPVQRALDLITGDTWPKRRRVVYVALLFCALVIAYALGAATAARDMTVVKAIAEMSFWLGGGIIGSYVFGSIWDDTNKRKHLPPASTPPAQAGEE
ncbi:hypothetical protein [Devosia faecipullorum]|uniref:hypothetical protein n=1 Tax=Devosia faecipullorum TaxID=2755039 RepID=UPI00187B6C8B|nr:hypothetical protein [Devosia faecipullorum]MBE7732187.1 hypothetical protein [Devosia faecipullorum]